MGFPLYIYGTPGLLGGAATKITHLMRLLRADAELHIISPSVRLLQDRDAQKITRSMGVDACLVKDLPDRMEGTVLAVCERDFFVSGAAQQMRKRGLRVVWSNEMMFPFPGEPEAVQEGLIDRVLFVSRHQADAFFEIYTGIPSFLTGNYIDPDDFPVEERNNPDFIVGRLSRADAAKYPLDFPVFYEALNLPEARFRVMAWNDDLDKRYRWHKFGPQWELLPANRETAARFLGKLDVFLYPLGHQVKESWGRAVVEAMLTGAVPVVPCGHHFDELMVSGESGFICREYRDFGACVRELFENESLRRIVGAAASGHARNILCNGEKHRRMWLEALFS